MSGDVARHREDLLRVHGEETWRVYEELDRSLERAGPTRCASSRASTCARARGSSTPAAATLRT